MGKKIKAVFLGILALSIISIIVGCASEPKLGSQTELHKLLAKMPAAPVAGKDLKFDFGGDTWIATVDGKKFMAGTFISDDSDTGNILTLKQTHVYSTEKKPGIGGDVGWIKTPGPDIILEYKKGPPETLTVR
jgi:hypothetical protein